MKKVFVSCMLFCAVVVVFPQSTNKARLKDTIAPVSTAALPPVSSTEIGHRILRIGETKSLADLAEDKNVTGWISSTPSVVTVNAEGDAEGLTMGSAFIHINISEYIAIAVIPAEDVYIVPESQTALLPPDSRAGSSDMEHLAEYRTEPTFRLAYRFNNQGEAKGSSGENGGIDILGRGNNYEWLWTTFYQGGWFYDLNGVTREMHDGYQRGANGVELTLKPEFIYDQGAPYLQIRHILHNTNQFPVTGQKFGASADIMMHQNDHAPLAYTTVGAYMADSEDQPTLELMFIGDSSAGVDTVDTLWMGEWDYGEHINHIYDDRREDIAGSDSAIGFSYKNIDLAADETKEFVIKFTLVRTDD